MSREIKFRAWDEKYKQFADYEEIEECLSCQNRDGWKSSDGMGCCFGINAVEILADCIIEQYTGLTDKNGKEIYEGDIVKARDWDGSWGKYRIKWKQSHCAFEAFERRKSGEWNWTLKGFIDIEVIGNIHENPELLEGK